ncbi:18288_t:CDS:2 [Rhizophagus irregularis]|nr:18288_t:CDS:2 [Rhizophagus irregularis]
MQNFLAEKKDEYFINIINEQKINESLKNLVTQKNEYDNVVVSWLCRCSDTYSPDSFRDLVEKNTYYCLNCNKQAEIFNISLRTSSYEPQTEYFINYRIVSQIKKFFEITKIVRHLIDNNKYQIYGYWLCRSWKCRHEPSCKTDFDCRFKWQSRHKWQCQHKPKCEGLWSTKWQCENEICRCQQKHDAKCEYSWLGNNKWLCQHNQKCKTERECQREWLCLNDWKSEEYTQELLKEYLKKPQNEQQYEFFRKDCKECGKRCQISSFHLYTSQEDESEGSNSPNLAPTPCSPLEPTSPPVEKLVEIQPQIPTVEIICHLVWNNHYRVFGKWTCKNYYRCFNDWSSSYTWIKLRKFIDEIPAEYLNRTDFYMQSCYDCKQSGNRLLEYEHLEEAAEINHHKRDLCKKCQYGEICHKTGDYLGVL